MVTARSLLLSVGFWGHLYDMSQFRSGNAKLEYVRYKDGRGYTKTRGYAMSRGAAILMTWK